MAEFVYNTLLPLGSADSACTFVSYSSSLDDRADESPPRPSQVIHNLQSPEASELLEEKEPKCSDREFSAPESDVSAGKLGTVLRREVFERCELHEEFADEDEFLSLQVGVTETHRDLNVVIPSSVRENECEKEFKAYANIPWRTGLRIQSPLLLLHQEVASFCDYLSPTMEEEEARKAAVERVIVAVKTLWPACEVKVFGSFATGLYLPTSDIDLVVLNSDVQSPQSGLYAIRRKLSRAAIGKQFQVIGRARVPIVKFIERESNLSFDISFDVQNGPEAANFIKDAVTKIPPLKPLCLILKIFLQQRELNEVYSGGIGSYALLVMLMAHLQTHWSHQNTRESSTLLEPNLGILLIDFFDLYGRKLNTYEVGISCRHGGHFFRKSSRGFYNPEKPHMLSVEDPQAPNNDIGKNSYNILKVRAAFARAYRILRDVHEYDLASPQNSILGQIIQIDKKLLYRKAECLNSACIQSFLDTSSSVDNNKSPYSDLTRLHPLMTEEEWPVRWGLYEDDPLPRGGDALEQDYEHQSPKRKLKRRRLEELENKFGRFSKKCRLNLFEKSKSKSRRNANRNRWT